MKSRMIWMRGVAGVAIAATALTVGLNKVYGSDHREAPTVDGLPEGDLTDVYCFTDPNDSTRVVFIMNVNPFANSSEASSYSFSPDMLYQFKIDNTGDAREDLVIQVTFDQSGTGQTASIYGPSVPTTTGARNTLLTATPTLKVPFNTVAGISPGVVGFVGLRDDPFVFDFAQFTRITQATPTQDFFRAVGTSFRGRAVRADGTSGVDSFGGFNVTSIAVSVPKTSLRGSTSKINVWATVSSRVPTRHGSKTYQQFERQGQQAFATLFVGTGTVNSATGATTSAGVTGAARGTARDAFNFAIPENDVAAYSNLLPDALTTTDTDGTNNTIAGRASTLTALGLAALPNGAPLLLPSTFANTSKDLLRIALLPDVLRLDLDLPLTNPAIGQFGLQNGRTLDYSSIDVPLQLLRQLSDVKFPTGSGVTGSGPVGSRFALGCTAFPACEDRRVLAVLQGTQWIKPDATITTYATTGGAPQAATVGNDRPFLAAFPYIAAPAPIPGEPGTTGYPAQQ